MTDMNGGGAQAAAELLIEARISGRIENFPEDCRPGSVEAVYAIQDAVASRLGPILGWKVGAANETATPICAPLLAGTLFDSPATLYPQAFTMRGMESEIAFRFGADLPPQSKPYEKDQVMAAIETALPAIEINESRFRDPDTVDPLSKLADNNLNGALVLGPPWAGWPGLVVAEQPVRMTFDDEVVFDHLGDNKAGDVIRLVVWMANHLGQRGHGLARGQVITTGSWTGLRPAGPARRISARFPGIGEVNVAFGKA